MSDDKPGVVVVPKSNSIFANTAIDKAVRDAETNAASVEVDTEKVEAAITHTADSWSLTAYARRLWKGKQTEAGVKATKSW